MNRLFMAATAALAIAGSAPAVAQYTYDTRADVNAGGSVGFANRIDQLEDRLDDGVDRGAIDSAEARLIRRDIRQLDRLERQYSANGLTQQERQDLQQRVRYVRQQLRAAEGRYARVSEDDDLFYEQAAATYPEVTRVCGNSRNLGSLLGRIFGSDNCLRVGERLYGNLSAVPTQYRNEFRDGSGYYYRYFDGYVVQVDTRTGVVTRIYDVPA